MLNFIDGLWSSCGDERIIIFTTNNKHRLDPALLRAGRMDMHINMSYCSREGLKVLVSNYLGGEATKHSTYGEIEELIGEMEVAPAEIAEELMKGEETEAVLGGLLGFLKRKREEQRKEKEEKKEEKGVEEDKIEEEEEEGDKIEEEEEATKKIKWELRNRVRRIGYGYRGRGRGRGRGTRRITM